MRRKDFRQRLLSTVFSKEGLLGKSLHPFEERECQKQMAARILSAYEEKKIALIEAGTGTRKSLAYLFPALFWAVKHKEKTVIATHTITLQEQLLEKDLPLLLDLMDEKVEVCLVKGRSNYICLRKLHEQLDTPSEESKQLQRICSLLERGEDVSPPPPLKERIASDADSCHGGRCKHYKACSFFKERAKALDAQILVVNQHLLLADIQKKRLFPAKEPILPPYQRLIIDEVHRFEQVALESFALRWDKLDTIRHLGRLHSEIHPERSSLPVLRETLSSSMQIPLPLLQKLDIDLPAQKKSCLQRLNESCAKLERFFPGIENRVRLKEESWSQPLWKEEMEPSLCSLADSLRKLSVMVLDLLEDLERLDRTCLSSQCMELKALSQKFEMMATLLFDFVRVERNEKRVRWLERTASSLSLLDASLDISSLLNEHLFSKQHTAILCSATIATAKSFTFLKQRLGLSLEQERVQEEIFESPFDYQKRVLFTVPTDFPLPSSPDFLPTCIETLSALIDASQGSLFFLFTSYEMLQHCYKALLSTPHSQRYPFLKQGDLPRHQLLETFKQQEGSVLFATDSFWEGVDVPGEALRAVVIVKLPFSVPSDPLHEAYAESLEKEGIDPFMNYSVPQAVIKFKQGFGRLMRKKTDRGCVVCLDSRLIKKGYGEQFLKSLPPCATYFGPRKEMVAQMRLFYDKVRAGA